MRTVSTIFLLVLGAPCQARLRRFLQTEPSEESNADYNEEVLAALAKYSEKDGPIPILPEDYAPGIFPPPGTPPTITEEDQKVFLDIETFEGDQGIVGGQSISEAPLWHVFPSIDKDRNCGGSLVSPDTVVTAAHCYNECDNVFFDCEEPCPRKVRIGSAFRSIGGKEFSVLPYSCTIHPNFVFGPNRFDVAVYKLTERVNLKKYAVIQANANFPGFPDSGEAERFYEFSAFGFGRFSNNEKSGAQVLRQVKMTYWHECQNYSGGNLYQPAHHVCAYTENDEGICFGDSGGPLVFFDEKKDIDYLTGIMSFLGRVVPPYCGQGVVDYFTRVGTYANWVVTQINTTTPTACNGFAARSSTNWFYSGIETFGNFFNDWWF